MLRLMRGCVAGCAVTAVLAAAPHAQEPAPAPYAPVKAGGADPRTHYDVTYYRLDLQVQPERKALAGIGVVQGRSMVEALSHVVIDLHRLYQVEGVHAVALDCGGEKHVPLGKRLTFKREGDQVIAELPAPAAKGTPFAVAVRYRGAPAPTGPRAFTGVHFRETPDGKPWINTSVQGIGSASWWPSKDSFFFPDDKHDVMDLNITVPAGLMAACNGELTKVEQAKGGQVRYRWHHPYGCATYSIALNVAPYVEIKDEVVLPGIAEPVPVRYYILSQDVSKAKVQFRQVPDILRVFGEKFGPFPFPKAKFSLVQTNYWGMEHSTIVAYGSSFPDALQPGERDRWASRNRWFDYILVHEIAHEWWGNSVTATDWGHFWVHEGFGTFCEVVWVEHVHGHDKMHKFVGELAMRVSDRGSVYRPNHKSG
ncbi:MAG: M1 family aminopeptidase, partial [Planctomycetota bacterium]